METPKSVFNPSPISPTHIATENARFMSRVYAWMCGGIAVSALVAFQISQNANAINYLMQNRLLLWLCFGAQFAAVITLSAALRKINSLAAAAIFLGYAALTGVTLSFIFLAFTRDSITAAFTLTAFSFGGLSAFGYATKRDLGPVGSFCIMGLFGMVGFSLISIFFPSLMDGVTQQVYSACGIVVFAGLTAYDTQRIKALNVLGNEGSEENRKEAIHGALILYLDFINLFISILRLMGRRR